MQLYPGLCVNKTASGAIAAYRIVKGTATDGEVSQSSAGADKHIGVSGQVGAADDARIDVFMTGLVPVAYGGAVAFGDQLTSDADGKAVVATAGTRVVGIAQENGVADDIGSLLLAPGSIPAAA